MDGDWRVRDQKEYLENKTFYEHIHHPYSPEWDHEHCEFCFEKMTEGSEAYSTLDDYYWVCQKCFCDFSKYFHFRMFEAERYPIISLKDVLKTEIGDLQSNEVYEIGRVLALVKRLEPYIEIPYPLIAQPVLVKLSLNWRKKHEMYPQTDIIAFSNIPTLVLYLEQLQTQFSENYSADANYMLCVTMADKALPHGNQLR